MVAHSVSSSNVPPEQLAARQVALSRIRQQHIGYNDDNNRDHVSDASHAANGIHRGQYISSQQNNGWVQSPISSSQLFGGASGRALTALRVPAAVPCWQPVCDYTDCPVELRSFVVLESARNRCL